MKKIWLTITTLVLTFSASPAFADTLVHQTNTGTADQSRFGRTDVPETCQVLEGISGEVSYVIASLKNVSAVSGNIYAELWTWTGSATSGSMLAQGVVDAGTVGATIEDVTFTFASPYTLDSGVDYCLAFYAASPDGVNYIRHGGSTGTPQQWFYDGASWSDTTNAQANVALWGPDAATTTTSTTATVDLSNLEIFSAMILFFCAFWTMMALVKI